MSGAMAAGAAGLTGIGPCLDVTVWMSCWISARAGADMRRRRMVSSVTLGRLENLRSSSEWMSTLSIRCSSSNGIGLMSSCKKAFSSWGREIFAYPALSTIMFRKLSIRDR